MHFLEWESAEILNHFFVHKQHSLIINSFNSLQLNSFPSVVYLATPRLFGNNNRVKKICLEKKIIRSEQKQWYLLLEILIYPRISSAIHFTTYLKDMAYMMDTKLESKKTLRYFIKRMYYQSKIFLFYFDIYIHNLWWLF